MGSLQDEQHEQCGLLVIQINNILLTTPPSWQRITISLIKKELFEIFDGTISCGYDRR